ncbi:MAG TPA: DUF4835 family protein [Prolixibacteraceae bacterium]|nr:DUF4835 family protein [Prolixibacteraceae bacterium]
MTKINQLFSILVLLLFTSTIVQAQELRCNISVNSNKLTSANKNVFRTMQADLYEFMNNKKWTKHNYTNAERIECSITIQITRQLSSNEYEGTLNIQSKRPVYNSSYKTTILNVQDEYFRFKYEEYQTIEYAETDNKDNLTSVLAYYAYVILGFDYDTFSLNGGTEYFEKARQIVNESQNAVGAKNGWKAFESDFNRYWLVENMLNKSYSSYRECLYRYHRKGLDAMADGVEAGRAEIADCLKLIQKVFRTRSKLYITQVFFDAKSSELVSLFSQSYPDEKNRVIQLLSECDPSNSSRYEAIKNSESTQSIAN